MPNLSELEGRRSLSLESKLIFLPSAEMQKCIIKNDCINFYYQKQFRKFKATSLYHKEKIAIVAKARSGCSYDYWIMGMPIWFLF